MSAAPLSRRWRPDTARGTTRPVAEPGSGLRRCARSGSKLVSRVVIGKAPQQRRRRDRIVTAAQSKPAGAYFAAVVVVASLSKSVANACLAFPGWAAALA